MCVDSVGQLGGVSIQKYEDSNCDSHGTKNQAVNCS